MYYPATKFECEGDEFRTKVNDTYTLIIILYLSFSRCDRAGLAGTIRLAAVRCPAGLAFDVYRQTCDWKAKVPNCDRLSSEYYST